MIRPIYRLDGSRDFLVRKFPVSVGGTINAGALCIVSNGYATEAGANFGNTAANTVIGVTAKAVTATDTEATIFVIGKDTVLECDVDIIDTTMTSDANTTTTFVDASLDGAANDELIGSKVEFITVAGSATDASVGTQKTITDYATGTGTLTWSGAVTGWTTSDTLKVVSLGTRIIGSVNLNIGSASDEIVLDGASATGSNSFRCVGVSDDGKRLLVKLY